MIRLTALMLTFASMGFAQDPPPAPPSEPPEPVQEVPDDEQQPPEDQAQTARARVDEILADQERVGQHLRGVGCQVEYSDTDELNLSTTRREGFVKYLRTGGNPLFWIEFHKQVTDDMVAESRIWYVFNGSSLLEARERDRAMIERQVVSAGQTLDLFDLDTAPFPMPFGQKRDEILKHFEVKLVPPKPADPENTDHLVCTPREGSPLARRYERLEFFVLRDLHLPRRILSIENGGYRTVVANFPDLSAESLRQKLTPQDFAEPAAWKKYARTVEKFENESSLKP
ncbi:MAG: hypothetical protein C4547_11865 [Phycisphaerales bacterium]|nr:MAG: hypothetical protein C4547_11865 [Phycisphaerales bacterium]